MQWYQKSSRVGTNRVMTLQWSRFPSPLKSKVSELYDAMVKCLKVHFIITEFLMQATPPLITVCLALKIVPQMHDFVSFEISAKFSFNLL